MTLISGIVKDNQLISEENWIKWIDSLRTDKKITTKEEAILKLSQLFEEAIKKRLPEGKFGIMFSGGVDSSLIAFVCKKLASNFICYNVGTSSSKDFIEAKKSAILIGVELKSLELDEKDIEVLLKKTISIIKEPNVVNAGVGATALAAIELAKKDNIHILFSGLGSEEIFAGYERHSLAKDVNEECWNGLKGMWKKDLLRDFAIGTHEKVTLLTPFLDEDLIKTAMQVPGEWKITAEQKKLILRETAESMGLHKEVAFRKKVAAQYGSGIDKVLEKLSKGKKTDYLKEILRN